LVYCSAFAQDTLQTFPAAHLEMYKKQITLDYGCLKSGDRYCEAIEHATSFDALMDATSAKKKSEDKRELERISVLECCLGIDTKMSCESLTPLAKKDLSDCKRTIKK
jgi:hypothetical protein